MAFCESCFDEYDDGQCHCDGSVNYRGYSNNCQDCGKWIDAKYTKCYTCNQKSRARNTQATVTGSWVKCDGRWCIQVDDSFGVEEGGKIKVTRRDGSSEIKTLGKYVQNGRYGEIYALG